MTDVRTFIKNLGADAPAFFDTTEKTIKRWVTTGNVPIRQAQKIFMAMQAAQQAQAPQQPQPQPQDPSLDPMTHLPINLDRRLPALQGKPPDVIEINPLEQSFGMNMTRPSRPPVSMQPMKLRDEGGQKVAYVEGTPAIADMKNPDGTPKVPALPPTIPQDWATQGAPMPTPKNDTRPAQRETKAVS